LFHLLVFFPPIIQPLFFRRHSLRAVLNKTCVRRCKACPAEMYSVIHRQKGKREMERKARNGGRKSCTDIFKRMLFISTSCESRSTNVTLPEVYISILSTSFGAWFAAGYVYVPGKMRSRYSILSAATYHFLHYFAFVGACHVLPLPVGGSGTAFLKESGVGSAVGPHPRQSYTFHSPV
jgi:hypothetical protein